MQFYKYNFNPVEWEQLKQTLEVSQIIGDESFVEWNQDLIITLVEIGHITKEDGRRSQMYSVDILWKEEEIAGFDRFRVWPEPIGVHSLGDSIDELYKDAYNNRL